MNLAVREDYFPAAVNFTVKGTILVMNHFLGTPIQPLANVDGTVEDFFFEKMMSLSKADTGRFFLLTTIKPPKLQVRKHLFRLLPIVVAKLKLLQILPKMLLRDMDYVYHECST